VKSGRRLSLCSESFVLKKVFHHEEGTGDSVPWEISHISIGKKKKATHRVLPCRPTITAHKKGKGRRRKVRCMVVNGDEVNFLITLISRPTEESFPGIICAGSLVEKAGGGHLIDAVREHRSRLELGASRPTVRKRR